MKLKALTKDKKIGIYVGSSPLQPDQSVIACRQLSELGFFYFAHIDPACAYDSKEHGFCSASGYDRFTSLQDLYKDSECGAILCSRGGYGAHQVLEQFQTNKFVTAPKAISGFSDVTPLLNFIQQKYGVPTIHGPSLMSLLNYQTSPEVKQSVDELFILLTDSSYRQTVNANLLKDGSGKGELLVGNLAMLVSVIGTPFDLDYKDKILVLEEVNEAPYRVHRMLMQLKLAGKLKDLQACVFGSFSYDKSRKGLTMDDVFELSLEDIFKDYSYPVLSGFPLGHQDRNMPLAIGCRASVVGAVFKTLESPLEE